MQIFVILHMLVAMASADTAIYMELSSIHLSDIVQLRKVLLETLEDQKKLLVSKLTATKDPSELVKFSSSVETVDTRISRITVLEDMLTKSLIIYWDLLKQGLVLENLDAMLEKERNIIIEGYQKIVLSMKNQQKSSTQTKKQEAKILLDSAAEAKDTGIVEDLLKHVSEKADSLEESMRDGFKDSQKSKTTTIETVLKVNDRAETESDKNVTVIPSSVLIDSDNNHYVLSKSGDITNHVEGIFYMKF